MAGITEIAELIGALPPPASREILRVSSVEAATPVALVFATDERTLEAALNSPAGAIITRRDLLKTGASAIDPLDPRLLAVGDPRYAFAVASRYLPSCEQAASGSSSHSSAPSVHPTAVLGVG